MPSGIAAVRTACFEALFDWTIRPSIDSTSRPSDLFYFIFAVAVAGRTGWLLLMWLSIGPVLYHRSLLNGGPFVRGDTVMILTGPQRGPISQIYGVGQHGELPVEFDEGKRRRYTDFFPAIGLLRVTAIEKS